MSWAGHEFLDVVRDPEVWRRTKEGAKTVGSFSFDVVKALAKGFIRMRAERLTGIQLEL